MQSDDHENPAIDLQSDETIAPLPRVTLLGTMTELADAPADVADRFVAALRSIPAASGLGHSQMVDSASSRTGSDESRPRGRPPVAGPPGPGALADALRRHRGNVSRVAAEMGLDRAWCYRLLRRHGLR